MKRFTGVASLLLAAGTFVAGCQSAIGEGDDVLDQVQHFGADSQCGFSSPGLQFVESADAMPPMRGDARQQAVEFLENEGGVVLLVALGERPTPGYGAQPESTDLTAEDELILTLASFTPDPGRMQAQVITTPCVVYGLPQTGWSKVTVALDADGFPQTLPNPVGE